MNSLDLEAARAIAETDCRYFELAAEVRRLPGAQLASMPGLEFMASSAVVQRVCAQDMDLPFPAWLDRLEATMRELGWEHFRIYLTSEPPDCARELRHRGYTRKVEALMERPVRDEPPGPLSLDHCATPEQWRLRDTVFLGADDGSDGHRLRPEAWCDLERRKAASGELRCLAVMLKDVCVGSVGYLLMGDRYRVKNLFVHPEHRNQGVARAMLHALNAQARALGARSICLLAIDPGPAIGLYRRFGMRTVGRQFEWIRSANPA